MKKRNKPIGQPESAEKEEGTVVIDFDGQKYKISYSLSGQLLNRVFEICNKSGYMLLKRISKALVRESCRIRGKKNLN